MTEEFLKQNLNNWETLIKRIFPEAVPKYCEWNKEDEITDILLKIGDVDNYTFMPDLGGFVLRYVKKSKIFNGLDIGYSEKSMLNIKPGKLTFNYFKDNYDLTYFRIYCIERGAVNTKNLELLNSSDYSDTTFYNDHKLIRYKKGSFVIFPKASRYNKPKYDMKHEEMAEKEFRDFIKSTFSI